MVPYNVQAQMQQAVQNAKIAEDGVVDDNERVVNSSNKMCKELVWYMDALQTQAEKAGGNPN